MSADPIVGAVPAPTEAQAKDLEISYEKHRSYAAAALLEYEQQYKELVQHFSGDHLEPLAKILLDHEKVQLQRDPLMESLRQAVLVRLQCAMSKFWSECDVENGLTSLQILKEKFKQYEGTNWGIVNKTPEERTLPMRMYFKNMCKRHLHKQLQYQDGLLKTTLDVNMKHRARIQEISQERVYLRRHMERSIKHFSDISSTLLNMQMQILDVLEGVNAE